MLECLADQLAAVYAFKDAPLHNHLLNIHRMRVADGAGEFVGGVVEVRPRWRRLESEAVQMRNHLPHLLHIHRLRGLGEVGVYGVGQCPLLAILHRLGLRQTIPHLFQRHPHADSPGDGSAAYGFSAINASHTARSSSGNLRYVSLCRTHIASFHPSGTARGRAEWASGSPMILRMCRTSSLGPTILQAPLSALYSPWPCAASAAVTVTASSHGQMRWHFSQ